MEYNLREKAEIVELAIKCAESYNTEGLRQWFELKFGVNRDKIEPEYDPKVITEITVTSGEEGTTFEAKNGKGEVLIGPDNHIN